MVEFLKGTPWESGTTNASDPTQYIITPKYRSPYTETPSLNTLARMYLSSELIENLRGVATNSPDSNFHFRAETILNKLHESVVGGKGPYLQFMLDGVVEAFEDRYQIVETLGDSYVIFGIGKKPHVFSFRGILLNCEEYDWRVQMIYLFEKFISISRLAKFKNYGPNFLTIAYDTLIISGAMLNLQTSITAGQELATPFNFSMVVSKIRSVPLGSLNRETQTRNARLRAATETRTEQKATPTFASNQPAERSTNPSTVTLTDLSHASASSNPKLMVQK